MSVSGHPLDALQPLSDSGEREVSDMTLVQVQKILGDRIEISLREDKTPEQRQQDNEQSALIMNIAKQMINNGDLILRIEKLAAQTKNLESIVSYDLIGSLK